MDASSKKDTHREVGKFEACHKNRVHILSTAPKYLFTEIMEEASKNGISMPVSLMLRNASTLRADFKPMRLTSKPIYAHTIQTRIIPTKGLST
jgi:hypothetical protein